MANAEVRVHVGISGAPASVRERLMQMEGEAYVVEVKEKTLILAGKGRHGTRFAVYDFLEQELGIRWLWPGELGEVVPRHTSVKVGEGMRVEKEPAFLWRGLGPEGALWNRYDRWEKEAQLGVSAQHQVQQREWEMRQRFGGEIIRGGHAWGKILPPSIYGPTNPEYYALVDGERDWKNFNGKHRAQLSTSNPDVVRLVAEWCIKQFDENPDWDGVSISPNDGRGFCMDERSLAQDTGEEQGDPGDPELGPPGRNRIITERMVIFGNQVAERVARVHPDKKLLLLAYSQYREPPKKVKAHPNLLIQCAINSSGFWNDAYRENAFREMEGWSRMAPTFGLYGYLTQANFPDMPRLVPHQIQQQLQELQRLGSRYYQTQAGNGFAVNGFNFYALGKLLWDPDLDVDQLLADYCEKGFGPAAPMMERYYRRLINNWQKRESPPIYMNSATLEDYEAVLAAYPMEFIDAARRDLDEAQHLCVGNHLRRVSFVKEGFRYYEQTILAAQATYPLLKAGWKMHGEIVPPPGADLSLLKRPRDLWLMRDDYIEAHKDSFVLSYLWVRYNDLLRTFNPHYRILKMNQFSAGHQGSDDTFAGLARPGPVYQIRGNQGYEQFTLLAWENDIKIDARGAHWSSHSWGSAPRDSLIKKTAINNYPIQIGADWVGPYPHRYDLYNYGRCPPPALTRISFFGGVIEGTQPYETTWRESKAANGGGLTLNARNSVIDGVRMHNLHDPVVPLEGNFFTLKNCWISDSRDDAIENDGFAAGWVEDCLIEGSFCFYSARNTRPDSGEQAEAPGGGKDSVVVFHNNLIGLGNLPGYDTVSGDHSRFPSGTPGYNLFWKQGDPRNPKIELVNNIFYLPKPTREVRMSRLSAIPQGLVHAEGNVVIWMGEGEYVLDHPGFTVLTGPEGQTYWDRARADWIARHPQVGRVHGDPGYDPEIHGKAVLPPEEVRKITAAALAQRMDVTHPIQ